MNTYPTLSDIEIRWQTAGGVCVIVEGETDQDDAWFYSRWFNNRASEITFYPQNGWEKVVDAVSELRRRIGGRKVYGIVDRDFETPTPYPPIPPSGVLRTSLFTLENYLLDPTCWFRFFGQFRGRASLVGWRTVGEAEATIESLYQECAPLSAYNGALRVARVANYAAFKSLSDRDKTDRIHPQQLENMDPEAELQRIQTDMGIAKDLAAEYRSRLASLRTISLADLPGRVSGKPVLTLFKGRFPLGSVNRKSWDAMLDAYVTTCPQPPADLESLVDMILDDAKQ